MKAAAAFGLATTLLAVSPTQVVTRSGRIGDLLMDASTPSAIVATLGRPDAERIGTLDGSRRYRALGYACSAKQTGDAWPLLRGGPYCQTVFFLSPRDRRVRDFYTHSVHYRLANGVRIGMATASAERLLHRRVTVGCEANIYLGALTVAFNGGHRDAHGHLVGGRVFAFTLHSLRGRDLGIFDCL